jgi:hypothetical protein
MAINVTPTAAVHIDDTCTAVAPSSRHASPESTIVIASAASSQRSGSPPDLVDMAGKPKGRKTSVKGVRYEDAADAPAPTVVAKIDKPSESMRNARDQSLDRPSSLRSGSGTSKIANLRAAFEKGGSQDSSSSLNSVKRRWTSSEKVNGAPSSPTGRLEDVNEDLEKEREMRQMYEEKCALLEEEAENLRHVFEQKSAFLVQEAEEQRQTYEQKYAALAETSEKERRQLEERIETLQRYADQERSIWEEELANLRDETDKLHAHVQKAPLTPTPPPSEELEIGVAVTGDELSWLRRQLAEMKRSISKSTRMDGQVTDSVFAQETGMLHHELQNWIVNNFRRAKGDVSSQDMVARLSSIELTPGQRHQLRPMFAAFTSDTKLPMFQATAACLLMDVFNDESLYGLNDDVLWRKKLREAGNGLEHVLSPSAHNKWRAVTMDVIRQSDGIQDSISSAAKVMAEKICRLLTALTEIEGGANRLAALTGIVKRAIDLQHMFRVQRARYQFDLPSTSDVYHPDVMENVSVDSESSDVEQMVRVVKCATFASVIKVGDEMGEQMHLTNVVFKAKVLCS